MILFQLPKQCPQDKPNQEILRRIPENATHILDVGCGSGALGKAIKTKQKCWVVGIERDPNLSLRAEERLDEVINKDAEKITIQDLKGEFDCIIFGDALEHFLNPWSTLQEYTHFLKSDGVILASIPNFQHISIQEALKKGSLEYQPCGLMDLTHLRLFTLSSIFQLFTQADLKIIDYSPRGHREKVYQYTITAKKYALAHNPKATTIVILNWNTLPFVKDCIQSIRKHTKEPYKIILVDNGSHDDCSEWARSQPDILTIENETNLGFSPGCNQAISATDTPYIMLLNGDTLVGPNWLANLVATAENDPKIGIVGAMSTIVAGYQKDLQAKYQTTKEFEAYAKKVSEERKGQTPEVDWIVFFAALIKREVFTTVGLLDPLFAYGGHDDLDFSWRARAAGFKCLVDHSVYIHHFYKKSSEANRSDYWGLLAKARQDFCRKWGIKQSPL